MALKFRLISYKLYMTSGSDLLIPYLWEKGGGQEEKENVTLGLWEQTTWNNHCLKWGFVIVVFPKHLLSHPHQIIFLHGSYRWRSISTQKEKKWSKHKNYIKENRISLPSAACDLESRSLPAKCEKLQPDTSLMLDNLFLYIMISEAHVTLELTSAADDLTQTSYYLSSIIVSRGRYVLVESSFILPTLEHRKMWSEHQWDRGGEYNPNRKMRQPATGRTHRKWLHYDNGVTLIL